MRELGIETGREARHGNYVIRAQIQSTIDVTPIETEGSRMLVILRIFNFSLQKIVS